MPLRSTLIWMRRDQQARERARNDEVDRAARLAVRRAVEIRGDDAIPAGFYPDMPGSARSALWCVVLGESGRGTYTDDESSDLGGQGDPPPAAGPSL